VSRCALLTPRCRSHFVIDAEGLLADSSVGVKPADSAPASYKVAEGLK